MIPFPAAAFSPQHHRLRFTAETTRGRYLILIGDWVIPVTHGQLEFLLCLAEAKLSSAHERTGLGRSRPPKDLAEKDALHHLVRRLRTDIDLATHTPGLGSLLIRHAGHSTYLLAIPADNILVDTELAELEPVFPRLIPRLLAARTAIAIATTADQQ